MNQYDPQFVELNKSVSDTATKSVIIHWLCFSANKTWQNVLTRKLGISISRFHYEQGRNFGEKQNGKN